MTMGVGVQWDEMHHKENKLLVLETDVSMLVFVNRQLCSKKDVFQFGVTSHELAHALGIFHEQSRFDRDESVVFNPRVVERDLLFNFAKVGILLNWKQDI